MEHILPFEEFILEEKKTKGGLDKWFKEKSGFSQKQYCKRKRRGGKYKS